MYWDKVSDATTKVFSNQYVHAFLTVFVILYAGLARPALPSFIAKLFEYAVFRLLVLFTIAWISSRDAQVALLVAVAFVLTMGFLSEQRMVEGFFAGVNGNKADE